MLQEPQVLFETLKPRCNAWGYTSEVLIISFFPQTPGNSVERFDEERIGPNGLCVLQRHKPILEIRPVNTYPGPAPFTELASEDHMLKSLLNVSPAKEAREIIPNIIMSSPQHVTSVQPVLQ